MFTNGTDTLSLFSNIANMILTISANTKPANCMMLTPTLRNFNGTMGELIPASSENGLANSLNLDNKMIPLVQPEITATPSLAATTGFNSTKLIKLLAFSAFKTTLNPSNNVKVRRVVPNLPVGPITYKNDIKVILDGKI